MAAETSIKLTYEDYLAIPDDGRRHEIIDGEHYVNPAPNLKHQTVLLTLASALRQHVLTHRLGRVVHAPFDVILGDRGYVQPDIIFVGNARVHLLTPDNMQGAPDLLVEVLSTNRSYDERVKFLIYERAGVPEYWIVNPFDDTVKVFRLSNRKYVSVDAGDPVTTPLIPGFAILQRDLFA